MSTHSLNILFLGGAKRVSIARMFKEAGRRRGVEVNIFSYELTPRVPIACVGRVIVGLRWDDESIYDDLRRVCVENEINVVLPFVDAAVGISARLAKVMDGITIPVSDPGVCDMMFDKALSAAEFERVHLPIPLTYYKGRPSFPLIAKPRCGSASKGIKVITNPIDFRNVITPPDRYLLQEYIEQREEYTVDCYVSMQGEITCISPRRRVEVVGGEVSRTVTVDTPEIKDLARRTIESIGLRGAVTVQVLHDLATCRYLLMEVNPRLGGGVVCSIHAGADIPGMIVDEALGFTPAKTDSITAGTEIVRYFEEVVFFPIEK